MSFIYVNPKLRQDDRIMSLAEELNGFDIPRLEPHIFAGVIAGTLIGLWDKAASEERDLTSEQISKRSYPNFGEAMIRHGLASQNPDGTIYFFRDGLFIEGGEDE